jgi:hypothetical protein
MYIQFRGSRFGSVEERLKINENIKDPGFASRPSGNFLIYPFSNGINQISDSNVRFIAKVVKNVPSHRHSQNRNKI